jgi:hypothetical protein
MLWMPRVMMCDANAVEHRRMHACIDFGYRRLEDRFKNLGSTFAFSDAIFDLCATTTGQDPSNSNTLICHEWFFLCVIAVLIKSDIQ